MKQLIVRNLEPEVVEALKRRAKAHGRSTEAEHREILRSALKSPAAGSSFFEWLLAIPEDEDEFERASDLPRKNDL